MNDVPKRVKRNVDEDEATEVIQYQRASNVMQNLLRILRSIDNIETEIFNEDNQRIDGHANRRSKRDTGAYVNNAIQVIHNPFFFQKVFNKNLFVFLYSLAIK